MKYNPRKALIFSAFCKLLTVAAVGFGLVGCGWVQGITDLNREVVFSVTINPGQIYEGQQARVHVKLMKEYGENKNISWSLYQTESQALATAADFVEVQGALSMRQNNESKEFTITSKPGSIASGTKSFKLVFSADGTKTEFDLTVLDSGTSSTISITSAQNGGYVNQANRNSYTVQGVCSTEGSDVNLVAEINGQSTNGITSCSPALTWSIPLNFATITNEGAVTLTATHAGGAGSIAATTLQITKDTLIPTMAIATPAPGTSINAISAASFTITGTCSEIGRIVTATLTSSGGGTAVPMSALCADVSGNGQWNATANISSLNDGTITAQFAHEDLAGNAVSANRTFTKDTLVPTLTIAAPTANQMFNSSNYNALTLSGACNKNGATITASGPLAGSLSTTCAAGAYSLSGLTLTGADGLKTITVNIADASGNTGQSSQNIQKDITAPTAVLSSAPGAFSNRVALNVTVGGTDVSEYLFKVGDSTSINCAVAGGYSAATPIATLITDALGADGAKRLCVRGIDANGNIQDLATATTVDWTKDTVVPVLAFTSPAGGAYVNRLAQSSFTIAGTCTEVGVQNVSLAGDILPLQVDCVSGSPNTWTANVDFSLALDGPVFVLASQTDAAGNTGSRTRAFTKATIDPTISFSLPLAGAFINNSNKASFAVSGACSTYSATPNITITSSALTAPVSATCSGSTWSASLAFNNGDESVSLTATITDAAGNTGTGTRNYNKDTNNPVLAITSPSAGAYVNNANKAAFAVGGTCSDVGTNNVVVSNGATATVNCVAGSPNTWSANLDFTAATDGAISITVTHTDAAGNTHAPTLSLNKDVTSPIIGWTLPLAQACASDVSGTSFAVSGTCVNGDGNVTLSSAQLSSSVTTPCTGGTWATTLNLNVTALADLAAFNISASQTDVAGNSGSLARGFKKISSTPSVILGGWDDIYSVGPKTYAANPGEVTPASEPGQVRLSWKEWPAGNTCMPEVVKVYRAASAGGAGSLVSNLDFPSGIPANVRTFTDNTLAGATLASVGSPTDFGKGWYYTLKVTIAGQDYNVTSPTQIAEVRVVAPPQNMALMHRWIANQEVCGLMGRTPDPTNHYRCSYSGWGKIVGNYYDQNQDSLIDRHELACNFTAQCGAGGNQPCLASEFSSINPAGAGIAGADGQVYYNDDGSDSKCWIKIAGTWREANWNNAALTPTLRAQMTTVAGHKPPLVRVDQNRAYETCQAHTVTLSQVAGFTSASKRLLRNIEWKAAAAWSPTLTDPQIVTLENGGALGRCNSSNAHGGLLTDRTYAGTFAFYSGSQSATAQCTSRYGLQDMVGNVWEWTSDQLGSCSGAGSTCVGVTSALDAGNTFMNGFLFDHVMSPGNGMVTEWTIESKSYGASYFSIPLGIPMITDDGGNAITVDSWLTPTNKFHGDRFYLYPTNGNISRGLLVGGPPVADPFSERGAS